MNKGYAKRVYNRISVDLPLFLWFDSSKEAESACKLLNIITNYSIEYKTRIFPNSSGYLAIFFERGTPGKEIANALIKHLALDEFGKETETPPSERPGPQGYLIREGSGKVT